jgi:cyclohexanone monooxygenase
MTEPLALSTDPRLEIPAKDIKSYARELNIELAFDPDALKEKYAQEKRKRDNQAGLSQYQSVRDSDFLKSYTEDLYADRTYTREAIKSGKYDVVIVGAGFTGIQAVRFLKKRGITNVCVIEKGHGFGGTWSV